MGARGFEQRTEQIENVASNSAYPSASNRGQGFSGASASSRRCFPKREAAGVGQPFESLPIVDCRLPIVLEQGQASRSAKLAIGNRQLEMLYVV
jgi:hypothetical protein